MSYDNNMRGVLFKNNDKREGKKDPDYRGNAEIDRKQFWLDAWINENRDGGKRLSLSFKPKQASEYKGAPANPPAQTAPPAAKHDFDDDIPF